MTRFSTSLVIGVVVSITLHAALLFVDGKFVQSKEVYGKDPQRAEFLLHARLVPQRLENPSPSNVVEHQPRKTIPSHVLAEQGRHAKYHLSTKAKVLQGVSLEQAQQQLAEHLTYPAQAQEQGLEGEVVVLLVLDEVGRIVEARVASSSGHAILDRAAVDAMQQVGQLVGQDSREVLFPVRFQLF